MTNLEVILIYTILDKRIKQPMTGKLFWKLFEKDERKL